jgi:hypothetical protein
MEPAGDEWGRLALFRRSVFFFGVGVPRRCFGAGVACVRTPLRVWEVGAAQGEGASHGQLILMWK